MTFTIDKIEMLADYTFDKKNSFEEELSGLKDNLTIINETHDTIINNIEDNTDLLNRVNKIENSLENINLSKLDISAIDKNRLSEETKDAFEKTKELINEILEKVDELNELEKTIAQKKNTCIEKILEKENLIKEYNASLNNSTI